MLNTLKRKIALVAVSAVGMSGLALMSAPAASALTTAITAVSTVPQRAASTANTVSVIVTSSSDTTQANNIVIGDTVNIVGRVLTAPTPAAADSLSSMTAGDSLSAINVFLPSGAASAAITLVGNLGNNSTQSAPYTNAFATAGTYTVLLWADAVATGPAALTAASGNNTIDGGEAAFTATITIGGTPTSFALSKTADTTAGASAASLGITLKDASSNPTLLANTGESITVVATMSSLQTDTLTVTKFQPTRFETFTVSRSADFNASNHSFWTADGNFVAAGTDNAAVGRAVAAITAGDSFTALTGSYNLTARHGGANVSTLTFNFGGSLTPVAAQTYTLTTSAVGGVTKAEFTNGSGLTTVAALRTAPVAIETATALSTVFASTTGAATIGWKLTGTAASIVNVVVSGSTVTGVTAGTYPTTIGADGTATYTLAATAPVAGQSYTISVNTATAGTAGTTISHTITYATPAVTAAALGSNGISTDLLTATVNSAIVKVGAKTDIKVTVVDQFGTPGQFYAVTGTLSAASRNAGATIATAVTDATGVATISLTDVSTSTTNLSDAITIQVSLAGVGAALLTGATNVLTLTYSATGAYASLAIAGGTTALATVTREIESVTSTTAGRSVDSEVTLTPTLTNSSGVTVTGVGITYTGSDGVFFRSAANAGIRPATGDLKTITAATGTTVRAFATKPGTATITATGGGLTATATFTVSAAVAATARNITAVAAAGRVTASVKDGWGNPIAGVVVNFAADSKGIFGNGVTSTSATTDATGQAAALVQSADGTGGDVAVIASLAVAAQSAAAALVPVADFATAGNGTVTVTAKPTAGAASTDTAITAVKTDVATANAAVKALATQVTVLQASVATLIDSLTTQIASLMKSVSALTKAVAKLQTATKKK
jgi:adhesin/invasin